MNKISGVKRPLKMGVKRPGCETAGNHLTNPNDAVKSTDQAKNAQPNRKPKRIITNNPTAPANLNKRTN